MAESVTSYEVRVSGLWTTSHRFFHAGSGGAGEPLGLLRVERVAGLVQRGHYSPGKGEVLLLRRDPGLLRSHFSLWTDGQEWLGSSLRGNFLRREVVLHTGSKPLRILPLASFGFGWTLQAPRTGEMARFLGSPLGRRQRIEVFRKVDFELVVFAYFLGFQILAESWWPGPRLASDAAPARPSPGT